MLLGTAPLHFCPLPFDLFYGPWNVRSLRLSIFFKVHDIVYVRKLGIVYICTPVVRKTWECWCEATENICYMAIIGASLSEPHMISQTVIVSVCPSVRLSICPSVQRTFTFRIYACSNLTQVCNISLVQSSASAIVR